MSLSALQRTDATDATHKFEVHDGQGVAIIAGFSAWDALYFFDAFKRRGLSPSIIRNGRILLKA